MHIYEHLVKILSSFFRHFSTSVEFLKNIFGTCLWNFVVKALLELLFFSSDFLVKSDSYSLLVKLLLRKLHELWSLLLWRKPWVTSNCNSRFHNLVIQIWRPFEGVIILKFGLLSQLYRLIQHFDLFFDYWCRLRDNRLKLFSKIFIIPVCVIPDKSRHSCKLFGHALVLLRCHLRLLGNAGLSIRTFNSFFGSGALLWAFNRLLLLSLRSKGLLWHLTGIAGRCF